MVICIKYKRFSWSPCVSYVSYSYLPIIKLDLKWLFLDAHNTHTVERAEIAVGRRMDTEDAVYTAPASPSPSFLT